MKYLIRLKKPKANNLYLYILMAFLKPFKALRPAPDVCHRVASVPYDVVNTGEARGLARDNPLSLIALNSVEKFQILKIY